MMVTGHFGEWFQGRFGQHGPIVLSTMTCCKMCIGISPNIGAENLVWERRQASEFLKTLGIHSIPNASLHSNIPPGGGAGASTVHLIALANLAGYQGADQELANACISFEGASDPLMFPSPSSLLWASRSGLIVQRINPPPPCEILGGFWGEGQKTDPDDDLFPDVSDLVENWQKANCLSEIAAIASESTMRCNLLKRQKDPTVDLANELGALGICRAHTGSARGLMFERGQVPENGKDALIEAGLSSVIQFQTGGVM